MAIGTPTSFEREQARASYPADLLTVGEHLSGTVTSPTMWLAKPLNATHVKLQVLGRNVRYKIDTMDASSTSGFQLPAGSDTLIPVPNTGISLAPESGAPTYEAQWVR